MISKLLPIIVFLAFCSGVGLGLYYKTKTTPVEDKSKGFKKGDPEVSVIVLKKEMIPIEEEFPGRVVANRIAEIRPQVGGIILKRLFTEGNDVTEGQVLYKIDPALFQVNFEKAKADLEKATTNLNLIQAKSLRYDQLIKVEGISKQEYDDIQANLAVSKADLKIAEAALANAKLTLSYTDIIAPISGRIGKSIVNEGSLVTPSQTSALAIITQFDQVYVDISQSSADFIRLRDQISKSEKISVRLFLNGEERPYKQEGQFQFSGVMVDQSTGALQLRAVFPNADHELLPGLFVKVRLQLGGQESILIPQRATSRNPDGELTVWKVNKEDSASQIIVKSDKTKGDKWVVTAGVAPGDRIIYKGFQRLTTQGTKVKTKVEGGE